MLRMPENSRVSFRESVFTIFRGAKFDKHILAVALTLFACSQIYADEVRLIQKTTVAKNALTFASGPAAKFSTTINGRTHQQTALTTYRGYQYVTFFDAQRRLCIGRRKLPADSWEVIQFADHKFESNDSHNTSVIGICDKDGTIHMAFDHHATPMNYRVSKQGAAHHPDSVVWNADLFGEVTHSLGSVATHERVTYPRFFSAPNGNLMLYYRGLTSGNGDGMIEQYDGDKHDWMPGLGKFIARDLGTYTFGGNMSLYRCPYMNSLSYAGKRLHASWVWRDRFERTDVANQHDLCYAYSDDHGRTWLNSQGTVIGKTGTDFIHLGSPGLVVAPIASHSGLTNQNTHYAYADGSVHVVVRQGVKDKTLLRFHHYWRSSQGDWGHEVLPFNGSRPKLVGTEDRTLVLVFTDEDEDDKEWLHIGVGRPNPEQTSWNWKEVKLPQPHSIGGDALLDLERWKSQKILSIYSQEQPMRLIETDKREPLDGFPSPLNVTDYRLVSDINDLTSRIESKSTSHPN